MIRFVYIGGQIIEDENDFAWFDTVTDTFLKFSGNQVWHSWDDFVEDYDGDDLARFHSLFPKNLNNKKFKATHETDRSQDYLLVDAHDVHIDESNNTIFWADHVRIDVGWEIYKIEEVSNEKDL